MYIPVPLIIIFVIIYLIYKTHNEKVNQRSLLPRWPIFGMLPSLFANRSRIHEYVTDAIKYRGGTFVFKGPWFSNMDMLITSDPVNVNYILSKNFSNFNKGPDFKEIFDTLREGIFNAEGQSWEWQRKTAMLLMCQNGFQDFVAMTSWNKTESRLIPILDLNSERGSEVDLQELFKRFAFDCTSVIVLGHDPVSLKEDLPYLPHEKAFGDAEDATLFRHILPEMLWKTQKWLNIGLEKKLTNAKKALAWYLSDSIELKRIKLRNSVGSGNEDVDLLASYMRKFPDASLDSEDIWVDTMLNLIFAGKDTISATLSWFFFLIAENPKEEEKIRNEIHTNLLTPEGRNWKFSNMDDLKNLKYLHGALCEALRLYPAVALQHKAPILSDTLPTGHKMKPNSRTVLSFYSMGRMESIWGKDCLDFKPGRWISETGNIKVEPSYKFTAFNSGPRLCIGKDISFIQMKIVAAAIISRFRIQLVDGHPVCPSTSVILHMKHGLKVKVSRYV